MKTKNVFLNITVLFFCILLSACSVSQKNSESENKSTVSKKMTVGVSILDMSNPYFVQLVSGIKKEVELRDIDIILDDPKSDVKKQVASIENFIKIKVDAIIIAALDEKELEPVLLKAMKAGIKVVAQSTKVENCDIFVSSDEWGMGHTVGQGAGRWIKEKLGGKADVAILNYPRISQIANREKGIRDGIEEFAPLARIVNISSASNPEEGKAAVLKMIKVNPEIKVVVGINDGGALGALAAFEEAGLITEDVFIGGVDATSEAIKKIKSGTAYRCTVDISPFNNGMVDIDFVVKLLNGQIVPNKYSIPAKLIDKNNLGGF